MVVINNNFININIKKLRFTKKIRNKKYIRLLKKIKIINCKI